MKYLAVLSLILVAGFARADDFVVVVLDTSGSMDDYMRKAGKSRLKVAQGALVDVLGQLPETTKVGILTFNGWAYDLGPVDRTKLEAAVRSTRAAGGTPLFQYIKAGADRLLKERQRQGNVGSYKLLVVTDGEATDARLNHDQPDRPGVLRDVIARGLMVDAIGLDMSGSHSLRKDINGRYMAGDNVESLRSAMQKSVAEVGFSGNDALAETTFAEIQELPESFSRAVVSGLTTFQNQPIGEKPPVLVIHEDGRVEYFHEATVVGWDKYWVIGGFAISAATVIMLIVLLVKLNRHVR